MSGMGRGARAGEGRGRAGGRLLHRIDVMFSFIHGGDSPKNAQFPPPPISE